MFSSLKLKQVLRITFKFYCHINNLGISSFSIDNKSILKFSEELIFSTFFTIPEAFATNLNLFKNQRDDDNELFLELIIKTYEHKRMSNMKTPMF